MAGWINSRQLEVIGFCARRTASSTSNSAGGTYGSPMTSGDAWLSRGRAVGRRRLGEFAGLVTPDTILRWYSEQLAQGLAGT